MRQEYGCAISLSYHLRYANDSVLLRNIPAFARIAHLVNCSAAGIYTRSRFTYQLLDRPAYPCRFLDERSSIDLFVLSTRPRMFLGGWSLGGLLASEHSCVQVLITGENGCAISLFIISGMQMMVCF